MPFASRAQQRYLESKGSPLTESQKREWEGATDFSALPEHAVKPKPEGALRYAKYAPKVRRAMKELAP